MPLGRRRKSRDEAKAAVRRGSDLAGAKRRRSVAADVERQDKRPRVQSRPSFIGPGVDFEYTLADRCSPLQLLVEPRIPRHRIQRPGIPAPTRTSAFVVPDRPSPPWRDDDKV